MYLHIGQNVVVPSDSVIGVFDIDNTTSSHITRKFLQKVEKEGNLIPVFDDIPKSFVLCREGEKTVVYFSQLSSQTLLKRSEQDTFELLSFEKESNQRKLYALDFANNED